MEDDELESGAVKLPTDNLHKSVSKAGVIILGIAFYMLLSPMWSVLEEYTGAEAELDPVMQQFTDYKKEETQLAETDPESPRIAELVELQKAMVEDIKSKRSNYKFYQKKFIVFVIVMIIVFLTGFITAMIGLIMCFEYRGNFKKPKPEGDDEDEGAEE